MKKLILILFLIFSSNANAAEQARRVVFTPAGTIAATNVQTAIEEVASEAVGGASLIPDTDDTYDIGEVTTPKEWRDLYIDRIAYIDNFGQSLLPISDKAYSLGQLGTRWDNLYVETAYIEKIGKDLIPSSQWDLGSTVNKWKDLHLSGIAYIGQVDTPSIISSTGSIDFSNENLSTTGTVAIGTLDVTGTIEAGSGNNVLTTVAGLIDGEKIADDTIDDDSIDFGTGVDQVSGADLDLTDVTVLTASGTVQGANLVSTNTLSVATSAIIGTTSISTGSITDSTGAINLGSSNITMGGDLTVGGNINLSSTSSGHVKPSVDLAYELGDATKRYARVAAKEVTFDLDSGWFFDENFVYLLVNGVEYVRYGATSLLEQIVFEAENIVLGGENVVF